MSPRVGLSVYAIKDNRCKSWFVGLQSVLLQYGLPSAYELISDPPMKLDWKRQVKTALNACCRDTILKDAAQKSKLKYLNCDKYRPGRIHPLWTSAGLNV